MSVAVWHTGTKAKTLKVLKDGGAQMYPELSDIMSQIENEDGIDDWNVAVMRCRICNKKTLVVLPVKMKVGIEDSECNNCGNMTCDPIDDEDEAETGLYVE